MAKKKTASPGPGKKECPACGAVVGVRTQKCACGHEFERKVKTSSTKPRSTEGGGLKDALMLEKNRLEDLLQNREALEERLQAINDLLDKM